MIQKFVFLILAIGSLSACTQQLTDPSSNFIPQNPLKGIQENMAWARVSCDEQNVNGGCSSSTGYVLAMINDPEKSGVAQCTGWVIAPNMIATNSHCIPKDLKSAGASCEGRMGIKFPAVNGLAEETRYCKKMVVVSEIDSEEISKFDRPDYAIFTIDIETTRPVIATSREGVETDQVYTVESIDPKSQTSPVGELTRRKCTSKRYSSQFPDDVDRFSSINAVFGDDCNAHHGNSGSAVLNSDGSSVAWLFAGMMKDPEFKSGVEFKGRRPYRAVYLTNIACLPEIAMLPTFGEPDLVACDSLVQTAKRLKAKANQQVEVFQAPLDKVMNEWLSKAPAGYVFELKLEKIFDDMWALNTKPVCRASDAKMSLEYQPAEFRLKITMDEFYRMTVNLSPIKGLGGRPYFAVVDRVCTDEELKAGSKKSYE